VRENGSTTVLILGVLGFLSIVTLGTYLFLQYSIQEIRKYETKERGRKALTAEAEKLVDLLVHDRTPYADSRLDAVCDYISESEGQRMHVTLTDVSSYYGINWVRKEILDHSSLMKFGKTSAELQQYRWDTGLHLHLVPDFQEFFSAEVLHSFFTPYSYFNINICDEFTIENLYFLRTGDKEKARLFRLKIQEYWKGSTPGKPRMVEPGELEGFIGSDFEVLFPLLNASPAINVHFAPEEILYQLLSYQYHNVPQSTTEFLLYNRGTQEWNEDELESIIGDRYTGTFLHHYVGVTTWFWRIEIETDSGEGSHVSLKWIVARVPSGPKNSDKKEYRLIEEEFSH
jgi:hypothetical protein